MEYLYLRKGVKFSLDVIAFVARTFAPPVVVHSFAAVIYFSM